MDEIEVLVELQRRSSLDSELYREQLLTHPDSIELPEAFVENGCVRVAAGSDDVPVGFATVVPGPDHAGELDGLFVEPAQMRRGIGRMLIEDAVARARAAGLTRIDVTANPAALEFYRALGFVTDGVAPTRFGPATHMHLDL
jgi:ribosomal protein S18 acetylase RimI-like enzyme